ncbi:FAD-binding protein [Stieleria varia]|uniref:Putative FAD-linked oxidoreductase n=1 Tax=Stieleria varia TaxID=2528005 RepID=A0A5C6ARV2_9BACT|nr:FAD-binding protein [Stieleria varia]TWU02231.1 putative FAD-linked oxidoreductase [Stieleria varia]
MSDSLQVDAPRSVDELQAFVREQPHVLVVGNQTKPPLWQPFAKSHRLVSTANLSGVMQYEPSEFTITVLAGTSVAEITSTLSDRGQYLPFDPMLVQSGATIGGTVAAGLSGPGRFRFGSIRDFLLGVRFLDGHGELICGGGKVVKNAAGFDIPKLLVGSLGRLGIITELTFKVFPRPVDRLTFRMDCDSHESAAALISKLALGRWELDALDYVAGSRTVYVRIAGDQPVIESLAEDVGRFLDRSTVRLDRDDANRFWSSVNELRFDGGDEFVWKTPTTPVEFVRLAKWADEQADDEVRVHGSAAMTTAWMSAKSPPDQSIAATGLMLRGLIPESDAFLSDRQPTDMERRLKTAFDPLARFP